MELVLPNKNMNKKDKHIAYITFANQLKQLGKHIGFKISARGWCYQMESFGLINKDEFDKVVNVVNKCRKKGLLPIDFTAEETARKFSGVETEEEETPLEYMKGYVEAVFKSPEWYTPDWWEDEDYYIQMLVEKIDLKTLYEPICREYHIPIATSKGWSSMHQRAEYARRFKEAERSGLKCVLLYCGDHDPDGLRISDNIRKNLRDLENITWGDGMRGYNPDELVIDRFGLNHDFIQEHNLTWIDNLITGSGKNLANPRHKNYHMDYVQEYLRLYGERKCEANAIIPQPDVARQFCRDVIEKGNADDYDIYLNKWDGLGPDAINRFRKKRQDVVNFLSEFRKRYNMENRLHNMIKTIEDAIENGEDYDL